MAKYGSSLNFMTLNILKLKFFIFFDFTIKLRATFQKSIEEHQFDVISSCFEQILDNYVFNISTCTLLAPPSKICRLFLILLLLLFQRELLGFVY